MPQDTDAKLFSNFNSWRVGARVLRQTADDLGTVVEISGKIKVKWDNGQTSYYNHGKKSNVRLNPFVPAVFNNGTKSGPR